MKNRAIAPDDRLSITYATQPIHKETMLVGLRSQLAIQEMHLAAGTRDRFSTDPAFAVDSLRRQIAAWEAK